MGEAAGTMGEAAGTMDGTAASGDAGPDGSEPAPAVDPAPAPPDWLGRAYHFHTWIHAIPGGGDQRPLGYLRRGARFLAGPPTEGGEGCPGSWHPLTPGGWVCAGGGAVLAEDRPPAPAPLVAPPPPADADAPLPYAYVRVIRPTWELLRLPADDQELGSLPDPAEAASAARGGEEDDPKDVSRSRDAADGVGSAPLRPERDVERPSESSIPIRGRLEPGWFLSVAAAGTPVGGETPGAPASGEPEGTGAVLRTVRGSYLRGADVVPVPPPTALGLGTRLVPGHTLPIAFPRRRDGARRLHARPGARPGITDRVPRGAAIPLAPATAADARWLVTRAGRRVLAADVRVARFRSRPAEVGADERWVHVDLSSQTLVAYEGDTPVFSTLVSTGRAAFPTPTGVFRLEAKHLTVSMDGGGGEGDGDGASADPAAEAYRIDDVPWVQFFEGGYALHGAFWHEAFGSPRSHGCVNLPPADARWLFRFTTPELPPGWHGRYVRRSTEGGVRATAVVVDP
jgi:lipoprotein-anchoring transpeptidase ErfK/SrfK